MFDTYAVELTLKRDMLGTNPCDPNVMDTHVIDRQRKLILEKGKLNKEINKYLEAVPIAKEKGEEEVNKIVDRLEQLTGYKFSDAEKLDLIAGKLENLKETFKDFDTKGTTIFFWDKENNLPMISSHMINGFLKAAAEAISRTLPKKMGRVLHSAAHTQKLINQHIRVKEEFIVFDRDIKRKEDGTPAFLQRSLRAKTAQGDRITLVKSEVVPAGAKLKFHLCVLENSELTREVLEKLFQYGEHFAGLGQNRNAGYGMFVTEIFQEGL